MSMKQLEEQQKNERKEKSLFRYFINIISIHSYFLYFNNIINNHKMHANNNMKKKKFI